MEKMKESNASILVILIIITFLGVAQGTIAVLGGFVK